jgi:hypothetical protein
MQRLRMARSAVRPEPLASILRSDGDHELDRILRFCAREARDRQAANRATAMDLQPHAE